VLEHHTRSSEIAQARVLTVTEVACHRVELLGGVAMDVDDLNDAGCELSEVEGLGKLNHLGVRQLVALGAMSS
jgi:hypothetical protein